MPVTPARLQVASCKQQTLSVDCPRFTYHTGFPFPFSIFQFAFGLLLLPLPFPTVHLPFSISHSPFSFIDFFLFPFSFQFNSIHSLTHSFTTSFFTDDCQSTNRSSFVRLLVRLLTQLCVCDVSECDDVTSVVVVVAAPSLCIHSFIRPSIPSFLHSFFVRRRTDEGEFADGRSPTPHPLGQSVRLSKFANVRVSVCPRQQTTQYNTTRKVKEHYINTHTHTHAQSSICLNGGTWHTNVDRPPHTHNMPL